MAEVPARSTSRFAQWLDAGGVEELSERFDTVEAWCLLPHLAGIGEPGDDSWLGRRQQGLRSFARSMRRASGPYLVRVGPVLLVSTSHQNLRVLQPLRTGLEAVFGAAIPVQLPELPLAVARRTLGGGARLASALQSTRRQITGVGVSGFDEVARTTVGHLARARLLLASTPPQAVVVASQHNSVSRALLAAADETGGIETWYVPHAPVADNLAYRDLPVDFAMLRGGAERRFYERLGADAHRMFDVGDPSVPGEAALSFERHGPVVVAGTVTTGDVLAAHLRVIAEANLPSVIFRPHPRAEPSQDRLAADLGWEVVRDRSTFEVLWTRRPSVLVQIQSGVGLEALRVGVPVVNLVGPDEPMNYPYLDSPFVASVSTTDELVAALDRFQFSETDPVERRTYAWSWSSAVGPEAVERFVEAASRCLAQTTAPRRLVDLWSLPASAVDP